MKGNAKKMSVQSLKNEIIEAANRYVSEGVIPNLPYTGYTIFLETGERLTFEKAYFERRRQLLALGLGYYLDKREETKTLLMQLLWEICNEYTWSLPAHLPISEGDYTHEAKTTIDLFAAETGQALSELLTLIGDSLDSILQCRILEEIECRILRPFEEKEWEWEDKENNWSAVIGGCIGMTAIDVVDDSARLSAIINRLDRSLASYLNGFGDDGACVEGIGYWNYGFGYFIYYAEKLRTIRGDHRYLTLPKVKAIAAFPYYTMIDSDKYVPFSDYAISALSSGLVSYCHQHFHVPVPQLIGGVSSFESDPCYRFAQMYRNLIWYDDAIAKKTAADVFHYYDSAQWLIVKKTDIFFAAKGGHNQESHNHLDVGHFILALDGTLFLSDLGAGEYTKEYFDEAHRYQFFVPSSRSHSIPVINGVIQQECGEQALIKEATNSRFVLSLAAFYPQAKLSSFIRSFDLEENRMTIVDQFQFQQTENVVKEQFITEIEPHVSGLSVRLSHEDNVCQLDFTTGTISVQPVVYKNHYGVESTAYVIQVVSQQEHDDQMKTVISWNKR
ncbi:hypothetical protein [Enterococcus sp. DIV0876]|uniref:hypothetical protein n=1 Tax=Enterococcus sp. DIV0876 TaxID=2774633 RepID=UPI003D2FA057